MIAARLMIGDVLLTVVAIVYCGCQDETPGRPMCSRRSGAMGGDVQHVKPGLR